MGLPPTKPRACESHGLLAAMRSLDYPPHGDTLARQEAMGRVEGDQTRRGVGDCSADPKKSRALVAHPASSQRRLRQGESCAAVLMSGLLPLRVCSSLFNLCQSFLLA